MDALTPTGTDPLTDLLNGVRTTGAVFNRSTLSGTWAVRFEDGSPLALAVPLAGPAWVVLHNDEPVRLDAGDVAVLSGGTPYTIAGNPSAAPDVTIRPGGHCITPDGTEHSTYNSGPAHPARPDSTVLLNGLYTVPSGTPGRLLAALPPLAVVSAQQGACPVNPEAFEDTLHPAPGRQALLDRMLDLMLITALRAWFTRPGAPLPAWYRAHSDPVVGHALRLLDTSLDRPWTVTSLAAATGVSRAALARRFTALVGQPPMTYLREQRIARAADLLRDPAATIGSVAARVGFSSSFALSTAFKKVRGASPSEYRATAPRAGG
ncbi:AraC family transcriptional regulator [Streptomyces sp. NPDC006235]|uniref:AraC family transcriptional regulator n=1 Tax=Streptomyces sp. NPDC006235 TaxID=3156736 RepID=UPI0033ADC25D